MKRDTIWAGESRRPCDTPECHNTAANFALHRQPSGHYVCVVCLIAQYRDRKGV